MDFEQTVRAFGALGHGTRLSVFVQLAREGARGLGAGELAARTGLVPSTLSFHLGDLVTARLVRAERAGREIRYAVAAKALHELLWFLGEEGCQGRTDLCTSPVARIEARLRAIGDSERESVLFVCAHNAARSQIAEALFRERCGDRYDVASAGLRPHRVHAMAKTVLREIGVDDAGLTAKDLGAMLGKRAFSHAVVLCSESKPECDRIAAFAQRTHYWPLPDPSAAVGDREQRLSVFRSVRDRLASRIDAFLVSRPRGRSTRRRSSSGKESVQ